MTNEDDSSEMKVRILMMITCESAYKQWLENVNNSAIPHTMPAQRSTINRRLLPVPRVQGYSVLADTNEDSVFTRLDLPRMDTQEVVPYLSAEYPTLDEVCPDLIYLSFLLISLLVGNPY